jgi:UDP-glucose 4-epimerase
VFVRWLDCIEEERPPQIHGTGSATMDFIYVGDVARANILALQSDTDCGVYNVGSGTETSLLELWQTLQAVTGAHHLSPVFQPPRKVNAVPRRLADTTRAERDLGFRAEVPLEEGLRRLRSWREKQRPVREVAV